MLMRFDVQQQGDDYHSNGRRPNASQDGLPTGRAPVHWAINTKTGRMEPPKWRNQREKTRKNKLHSFTCRRSFRFQSTYQLAAALKCPWFIMRRRCLDREIEINSQLVFEQTKTKLREKMNIEPISRRWIQVELHSEPERISPSAGSNPPTDRVENHPQISHRAKSNSWTFRQLGKNIQNVIF